ncbi:Hypothetical protein PHPALM_36259 [Phytophthora palmivora]|uniref:Integrase catalytic domain-containing protein n=1 Tax=Phytophthora palmivora TaxID=4796 RepID=A0A2P4X0E2_9STRA|nr:Hypothetical protein PHPALM_36259 [Phytophthora palmivora]
MVYFERTYNVRVHVLRTDGGGEYKPLDMFCARTGIARQVTEPHTSASNGKAERLHRTIMNMVRCMLFGCGLPLNYWGYAAEYAAYVLNRMPTRANVGRKPPLEMLTGKPVNVTDIVAFGSPCTVYANPKKALDRRGTGGIIVGKNEETEGYKVIVVKDNVVVTTRHVGNIETLSSEANEQLQAMPDAHLWQMAFDEEVNSLEANETREPVITPDDANVIYSKSVYKKKLDGDGKIGRYKARIVAGGDKQVLGRDYEMTFSAVLDLTSGKIILAVAHIWRVRAKHYDVPNAYVRAFKEPQFQIYMRTPEGMKLSREQLRRLGVSDQIRSLYGLKQAGRLWNRLQHETLTNDAGMAQSTTDACVYYKVTSRGTTLVGVYVDDLLATATSEELLTEFEHNMKSMELKVGLAENFLGMRISYDEKTGYAVDAERTIVDLLGKFGLQKANAVRVPIADESMLEAEAGNDELLPEHGSGTLERPTRQMFQSLVGSLLWLVRTTRPDAMYAVHRATRRSHAPTLQDWKLAKRIMRYLAGTASLKFHLGSGINTEDVVVSAYTDADYAADKQSRKSVSGSVILVNGMTVGWLVKQQTSVALSTAEAEFVAAAVGVREALGIRNLLEEIGLSVALPVRVMIDNQAAIKQVENEATSSVAKHVDVKLKYVWDESCRGIVKPEYVDTKAQLADIFTKSLAAPRIAELREMLSLK